MFYFITTENGFIKSFGTAEKAAYTVVSEQQYAEVLSAVSTKPSDAEGHTYMLRADTLEWELVELPETEPTTDEVIDYLFGGDAE